MTHRPRSLAAGVAASLLLAAAGAGAPTDAAGQAARPSQAAAAPAVDATVGSRYRVAAPAVDGEVRIDPRLLARRGPVDVWVSLEQNSVAAERAVAAEASGLLAAGDAAVAVKSAPSLRRAAMAHRQRIVEAQAGLSARIASLGGRELARVQVAHNAIAVRIEASQLRSLAALEGVAKVRPVLRYQMTLAETVPYVGGSAVQAAGRDGSGVTVAVLDSGIDYTHRNFGGAGTTAAYAAAYGSSTSDPRTTSLDGLFPTAKVVAGYDFVGEAWPNAAEASDPDPIDRQGHGTHVADIIAGKSVDGSHKGVAPGAELVAVKVCSAVATSCSGIALLQGMDFALDPNGDGDTADAVDVINLSLGSDYGQSEDDLSLAATNAVRLGVVVVASAGNGGNKPYVVGSPSIAPGVLSVAQTQVPSARAFPLVVNAPAALAGVYGNTATLDFAPVGGGLTGDVAYVGRGCPADSVGPGVAADAYLASPAGKIALIDRGSCSVSLKVDRAAKAGATGVLIGLVAPGDAVAFSFGGGDTFVPTLVIQQALSSSIKSRLAAAPVSVSITPAAAVALIGSMASTSSRGPSIDRQTIKPEIGAPGASLSAEVGTGTGQTAFGGTSGASPMVAGAAALMLQAYPNRSPERIKAMLMNGSEPVVYTQPALVPGELAPITRIGAGELRVDRAIGLRAAAWNPATRSAALSFGAVEAAAPVTLERTLRVDNFANVERAFTITPTFRYDDDRSSGAVRVVVDPTVTIAPRRHQDVVVKLVIDPTRLPAWTLDGGAQGGNGATLNGPEYDGFLTLTSGSEKLSVPWHVLPRKAARVDTTWVRGGTSEPSLALRNGGVETGEYDVFSLLGVSPRIPRSELPRPGDNEEVIDLRAFGVRHLPRASFGADYLEFAIATFGRRAQPNYPAGFEIEIDTTGDGVPDYVVYNAESGGFAATGQSLAYVANLRTGSATAFFYVDADLNSGNMILTVPLEALKVAPGKTIGMSLRAYDNYFTGNLTDEIVAKRFTPGGERFAVVGAPSGSVAPAASASRAVATRQAGEAQSSEIGLLLMYRRNAGAEAEVVLPR